MEELHETEKTRKVTPKKSRAEYHRAWNKKNKDKVRAAQERYWYNRVLKSVYGNDTPAELMQTAEQ